MEKFETTEELIHSLIIDDLDQSISPEDKLLLDGWRNVSAANEKIYQDFLHVQINIDKIYGLNGNDPQSSWDVLDKKLDTAGHVESEGITKRLQPAMWYKIAAAVLLTLSIGYYFIWDSAYVVINTAGNVAITRMVLPDGTEVDMNASTSIRYNKNNFMADRKLELLQGEVFIHVVKHTASQFRVTLGELEAQDIGTSFNVIRNDQKTVVMVEDGIVALKHQDSNEQVVLTAGKIGLYNARTRQLSAADNLNLNYKAWIDKQFVFQEVPLAQVTDQLGKVYQMPVTIEAELKNRKFTGRLHYETLDSALAVISASLQCKVTKGNNTYVLSDN